MSNPFSRPNKRKPVSTEPKLPSEDEIQVQIMNWCKLQRYKDYTLFDYFHHSPNGGIRTASAGAKFKKAGTKAGYPDLLLDIPRNGYHGLRIELKRDKGGTVSGKQKERLAMLQDEGYKAVVCRGFDESIKTITKYMELNK